MHVEAPDCNCRADRHLTPQVDKRHTTDGRICRQDTAFALCVVPLPLQAAQTVPLSSRTFSRGIDERNRHPGPHRSLGQALQDWGLAVEPIDLASDQRAAKL